MEIIQLGECHADYIQQIVAMTQEFSDESHIYKRLGFNADKFRQYIQQHFQPPACVLATVDNGNITGYAIFLIDMTYIDHPNFEIITIYVPARYRKSGAGRMLAKALVETMDINSCKYGQISICCAMEDDEALINMLTQNMFSKLGFYQIGIVMGRKGKTWDS